MGEKERVSLFDKVTFEDSCSAKDMYDKECKKFKFKAICAGLSLLTTISFALSETIVGEWLQTNLFVSIVITAMAVIGYVATLLTGPIQIIKTIFKFGKFGYYIIPFTLIDLIGFAFGVILGLICFLIVPIVYSGINLYQSYLFREVAKEFMTTGFSDVVPDTEGSILV